MAGNFFNVLKILYLNDKCCVFEANQGVKQGCIPSPLLFNIFLSDVVTLFSKTEYTPLKLGNSETIGCLLWVDDLVVLFETENGFV